MEYSAMDVTAPVRGMTSAWLKSSRHVSRSFVHMYSSVAEANRAMLARQNGASGVREPEVDSVAYTEESWSMERSVDSDEELGVGDVVRFTKQITEEDVLAFAGISGDTNRLHLDEEFAEETRFGRRIVHGTLASGLISSALARLPGMTVYLSQDLRFLKPVDIGSELTAVVEIVEDLGDRRYRLDTVVQTADETTVIDGEAVVLIDPAPESE
ncbi:acyl dehydratase [Salinigranum rubrum]|uniref:Acyl dehydratase n=2 Tax=Salinigranum rubrum TaxID=755307 RepID=A0A2I8VHC8_9EURY|nr:acyl dehydratase [Salinigranum rubrum]